MAVINTPEPVGMVLKINCGTAGVVVGDSLYYSAGDDQWLQADADDQAAYAQVFVVAVPDSSATVDGTLVWVAREAYFRVDNADNLTEGAYLYLSATAGEYTETRPTTEDDLVQIIGQVLPQAGIDAPDSNEGNIIHLWGAKPHEYNMSLMPHSNASGGTSTFGALDTGAHGSVILNEANERAHFHCQIPTSAVALAAANLWIGIETDVDPVFSIDVDSGGTTEQHDNANDTLASATYDPAAADALLVVNVAAALNATGLIDPKRHLAVAVNNTGTVAVHIFSLALDWRVV